MQRMYYYDSYKKSFTANVVDVNFVNGYFEIILDETYFYPKSGGQPADTGTIDGIKVEDVILKGDNVVHVLKEAPTSKSVSCKIDWDKRYDNMQQHTGQHLLSAVFYKLYGAETESFSIDDLCSHITITNNNLSEKEFEEVENEVNKLIYSNLPVLTYFVDNDKLYELPLRKKPKVNDNIRIIEIKDIDYSPCGGTHVKSLGEIGIIKIRNYEKAKKGIRVEFVCGFRAFKDYIEKNNCINRLVSVLSAKENEIADKVDKLILENKKLKKELNTLKENILLYEADKLIGESVNLNKYKLVVKIFDDKNLKELRALSQDIVRRNGVISILCSASENADIVISRSDDVDIDINSFFNVILDIIDGNGGGNQKICQGSGKKKENLNKALEEAIKLISTC